MRLVNWAWSHEDSATLSNKRNCHRIYFKYFLCQLKKDGSSHPSKQGGLNTFFWFHFPFKMLLQCKDFVKGDKILKDKGERKCSKNGESEMNTMLETGKQMVHDEWFGDQACVAEWRREANRLPPRAPERHRIGHPRNLSEGRGC